MADTLEFELISPQKTLVREPASMVVTPGAEGDFAAMARHSPLLSTLRPGAIVVHRDGGVVRRLFVAAGFAEVTATRCTVLAEDAHDVSGLTREEVEARLQAARDAVAEADDDAEEAAARKTLSIAEAMAACLD